MERPSLIASLFRQLCPRCRRGKIFRTSIVFSIPKMYERCPVCDLKFEREQGYFLGAMYISYGLALVTITIIALLLWLGLKWSFQKTVVWAIAFFVPFAPVLTFFSRVLWIYLDQAVDPDKTAQ
jgi:uncharacterized protein (DUF983 family)